MTDTIGLVFGRERQISLRYLLIGVGVSIFVVDIKFVGYTFGGLEVLFTSIWAIILLLLVVVALGAAHARENEGLLIAVLLAFLPVLTEREFDIFFGIGYPTPSVLYGAWLALLFAVLVGVVAFVIGQRL